MHTSNASIRILRIAAWIWISFLLAMAAMDFVLYTTQPSLAASQNPPLLQGAQNQQSPSLDPQSNQPNQPANPFKPVYFFYATSGLIALTFFAFAHSGWIQKKLGNIFCPLLLLIISTAPIFISVLITPRFPNGPLANAEGMALRQVPVLFIALVLVAWEYKLFHVILFSLATTAVEFLLIYFNPIPSSNIFVLLFISIIRTISFIAVGVFISLLVAQLREQRESLRKANANLTHYASTLEQLTVSRERNRLARELHDTVAHSLTAISLSLETAKAYFDIDLAQTRDLIDRSLESTHAGVDETRRALKALRSNALEDMGLRLAIQRAAESAAARLRLNLTLDLKNPIPSLSPDVEQAIYRIAQEAIENIVSHSHAKNFKVYLESDSHTTLIIQDDGVGFDLTAKVTGHFGVVGMHERAELAGGKLLIESENGKGTKVVLTI